MIRRPPRSTRTDTLFPYTRSSDLVIRFDKLGYARTDVALPGLVGGPCLEKDPHILLASVAPKGVSLEITAASRLVHERQPGETVTAAIARASERAAGQIGRASWRERLCHDV